ncbi:MAG: Fur family transcriptional regulator [Gemmataceae bacterium]
MTLPAVPVSQTPENKFREYLLSRPRPLRITKPQVALVGHIFSQHDHFDADQLILDVQKAGLGISRATIYRTLTKLVDAGLLRRIEVGPRTVYEHDYGYPQHEHLVCERCGKMIEFQSEPIQSAMREVCAQNGFAASGHTLVVRGICADCNRARNPKRRLDLI